MRWRVLPVREVGPYATFALDEALLASVQKYPDRPVLRVYRFSKPAVSIAYRQRASDVNTDIPEADMKLKLARRLSTGAGLFHGTADVAFTVAAPRSEFPDAERMYETISDCMLPLFPGATHYRGTILFGDRKVSGSAQARRPEYPGAVYQHGSVFCFSDAEERAELLSRIHGQTISRLQIASASTDEDFADRLLETMASQLGAWERSSLTDEEAERADRLRSERYETEAWNIGFGARQIGSCETSRGAHPDPQE